MGTDLKYVSLHNHTTFSIYDGLGTPKEFFSSVLESGGDGLAITEHGSCNSLGYVVSAAQELKQKGVKFRPIYGVEAYIHPNLDDWHRAYHEDLDTTNALVVENEQESKNSKWYDPIRRRHHLVITVLNNTGLQNLFTLVSLSYRRENFYRFPRMDFGMLRKYNDGLAISTACLAGLPTFLSLKDENADLESVMQLYDQELLPLLEIFGPERAFLELQFNAIAPQRIVNNHLIEYSKRSNYKLIVASDAHYCRPDLWREREIYKSLGRQMLKAGADLAASIPQNIEDLQCELYPHNAEQIYGAYEKYFRDETGTTDQTVRDAINRTHDIAWQLVGEVRPNSTIKLPPYTPLANAPTPFDRLRNLCHDRLREKGLANNRQYVERTVYELKIIKDKGISEYFLTKKAILDTLRKELLLGTGRGSGAGSIVNYLLDITLADPIKGGLLFERFISPSRAEMPDIDSDCEDKDQAYELLKQQFGEDNVLAISNYNTLKLKSLVKDVSKLYEVPFHIVNRVTQTMEAEARDAIMDEIGHDQKLYEFTFEKAYQHSRMFKLFIDHYPKVGECLSTLYKSVKSIGRHAGGILVVPEAHRHLPIIRVRNVLQSPFTEGITAQHLKLFGLVKFDVLALTTLRIIRRCIELILKSWGIPSPTTQEVWDFYNSNLHPDVIDPADKQVFANVYHAGRFPSIFQFAEQGVQAFVKKAKPKSVNDLATITAIFRPGPLKGQADKRYLEASEGEIQYGHPILEEVLGETRGILIFQEQFMLLANKLAGFSLDEADKLRKLLVKPSTELGQEMRQQRIKVGERFISGCMEKGLTKERAYDLWHKEILGFISYGFNKSHSYVYAYNSYQCAWLFTYHEQEWIKACLEKDSDLEKAVFTILQLGYEVAKPDVNDSLADEWQILGNRCVPPLVAIKGVGDTGSQELVKTRTEPFHSIEDFFWSKDSKGHNKWRWSKFNRKALDALICLEAFESLACVGPDSLFQNYHHMHQFVLDNFDRIKKGVVKEGRGKTATVTDLNLAEMVQEAEAPSDWSNVEKIRKQKELINSFDKSLLFSPKQQAFLNKYDIRPYTQANEEATIAAWFFILKIEKKLTVRGKPYAKLLISDGYANEKSINYFEPDISRLRLDGLHIANLQFRDWFLNTAGKIHAINQ
jgi:DNA polymerase III subunit alpha